MKERLGQMNFSNSLKASYRTQDEVDQAEYKILVKKQMIIVNVEVI